MSDHLNIVGPGSDDSVPVQLDVYGRVLCICPKCKKERTLPPGVVADLQGVLASIHESAAAEENRLQEVGEEPDFTIPPHGLDMLTGRTKTWSWIAFDKTMVSHPGMADFSAPPAVLDQLATNFRGAAIVNKSHCIPAEFQCDGKSKQLGWITALDRVGTPGGLRALVEWFDASDVEWVDTMVRNGSCSVALSIGGIVETGFSLTGVIWYGIPVEPKGQLDMMADNMGATSWDTAPRSVRRSSLENTAKHLGDILSGVEDADDPVVIGHAKEISR